MLLVAGLHAIAASGVFALLILLRQPIPLFWSFVGFLLLEGVLLVLGLVGSPLYRVWGLLMGLCVDIAAIVLLVLWLLAPKDYDIQDIASGASSALYGIALIVAAIQVRALAREAPVILQL